MSIEDLVPKEQLAQFKKEVKDYSKTTIELASKFFDVKEEVIKAIVDAGFIFIVDGDMDCYDVSISIWHTDRKTNTAVKIDITDKIITLYQNLVKLHFG